MTDNNLKYTLENRFDNSCLTGPITSGLLFCRLSVQLNELLFALLLLSLAWAQIYHEQISIRRENSQAFFFVFRRTFWHPNYTFWFEVLRLFREQSWRKLLVLLRLGRWGPPGRYDVGGWYNITWEFLGLQSGPVLLQ